MVWTDDDMIPSVGRRKRSAGSFRGLVTVHMVWICTNGTDGTDPYTQSVQLKNILKKCDQEKNWACAKFGSFMKFMKDPCAKFGPNPSFRKEVISLSTRGSMP